jgi:hypothetical protein
MFQKKYTDNRSQLQRTGAGHVIVKQIFYKSENKDRSDAKNLNALFVSWILVFRSRVNFQNPIFIYYVISLTLSVA